jgi:hypothetical protein
VEPSTNVTVHSSDEPLPVRMAKEKPSPEARVDALPDVVLPVQV